MLQILSDKVEGPKQKSGFQVGFFPQGGMVGMGQLLFELGLSIAGCYWIIRERGV
jgi:hypothetical protein